MEKHEYADSMSALEKEWSITQFAFMQNLPLYKMYRGKPYYFCAGTTIAKTKQGEQRMVWKIGYTRNGIWLKKYTATGRCFTEAIYEAAYHLGKSGFDLYSRKSAAQMYNEEAANPESDLIDLPF